MADENLQTPEGMPDAEPASGFSDAAETSGLTGAEAPKNREERTTGDSESDEVAMPWEEEISFPPEAREEQADAGAGVGADSGLEQAPDRSDDPPSLDGEFAPYPQFDPVAVFLSTQSVSGTPRIPSGEDQDGPDASASEEAETPDNAYSDEHEHEHGDEPEDELEPEPVAPVDHHYKRHPLVRAFNFFCWCLLLTFVAGAGAGFLYFRYAQERLYSARPGTPRHADVVIESGDSYRKVIGRLKEAGLLTSYMGIDDTYLMRYLGWYSGNSARIRHGAYRFDSTASLSEVYTKLLKGSQDFKLTIPEGLTVEQIADLVARTYDTLSAQRFVELTQDQGFITSLGMYVPTLEGYLLPSTYYFGPGMNEEEMLRRMVAEFRKVAEARLKGVEKKDDLSFHEHVILASLVEREARVDEDRPMIASVILNRINKGMRLEIDATVNYALNEWRRLSHADLKVDSPFNTYKIKGLPPAPICNPRMDSLIATYTAPASDFLFYVHRGDGRHEFARSYEEHQKNVRRFITSRPKSPVAKEKEKGAEGGKESRRDG